MQPPATESLTQLPLFPLQSVLFPGGYLPLRIFEVRYLDMIGRHHKSALPFGVVCLTEGREVRVPRDPGSSAGDGFASEAFHDEGTLASIIQLERPHPGLMMIRCTGTRRFRIRSRERMKHGLWIADVDLLPPDPIVAVPADLEATGVALQELLKSLAERTADEADVPVQPPYRWSDSGWLANRWCELLPMGAQEKQRLMTLDNPLLRLELVTDALEQMGLSKTASGRQA